MDAFLTFLSNYYIWFLVAAGLFLFALIGLIIESSKKHKKDVQESDTSDVATVEAFRSGERNTTSFDYSPDVNLEATPEMSNENNNQEQIEKILDNYYKK